MGLHEVRTQINFDIEVKAEQLDSGQIRAYMSPFGMVFDGNDIDEIQAKVESAAKFFVDSLGELPDGANLMQAYFNRHAINHSFTYIKPPVQSEGGITVWRLQQRMPIFA